ncbi:DUF1758 domain-containing protein [Trichonephila clavipes]|nr:DUF1758 domain-containing protein [Trichonephila clavipes]
MLKVTERVAQENINTALDEIKGSNSFTKCGISIDDTWQCRGFSSLNCCLSAISVDTGKNLDIEVMTQYCHICAKGNSQSSKHVCSNYKGSAGNMEVVGAYRIFERSNVRNVQYNEYYGDGDSKGYESVKNFYGINTVTKLECIGHVQKRVGGRLRQLKKRRKDNYKSCLNLLKDRYGRHDHLISCYMNKLLETEPVKSSFNLKGLRKWHDESEINIRNLDSMGIASGNYGHLLIPIIIKQLPHDLVVQFHRQKGSKNIGDVRELMKFIKFEIESRESANIALGHSQKIPENSRYPPRNLSYQRQQPKFKHNPPSSSALTTVIKTVCIFCNSDTHTSIGCQIFSNG